MTDKTAPTDIQTVRAIVFPGGFNWPIFVAVFVGVVLIFSAETIIDGFAAP